jgi:hypothetical protein
MSQSSQHICQRFIFSHTWVTIKRKQAATKAHALQFRHMSDVL